MATGYTSAQDRITTNRDNFCRLIVMIVDGCTQILRTLLLRHVEASTPPDHAHNPWTLDEFLLANQAAVHKQLGISKGKKQRGKQECHLFPSQGSTDIEKWDFVLLTAILVEVCNYKEQKPLNQYLYKMKDIRNSICHKGNTSISNESFKAHFDQLKTCIEKCCNFLGDKAFKDKMCAFVDRVECSRFSLEDRSRDLEDLQDSSESIEEGPEQLNVDLQEKGSTWTAAFESFLHRMEIPLHKEYPTVRLTTGEPIEVPDTITVGIHFKKCEREKDRQLSQNITQLMTQNLRSDPNLDEELSDKSWQNINQIITKTMMTILSSDREVVDVSSKCVMVVIRCSNYGSFKDLLYQSVNGELTDKFKPVERAIRQLDGYEDLSLEVSVSDVDFWKCMDLLVRNMFTGHGFAQENLAVKQHISSDATASETSIDEDTPVVMIRSPAECEEHTGSKHEGSCILVKSRLIGQYIHMVDKCTYEPTDSSLTQWLADILIEYYRLKYLSIETSTKIGMVSEYTNKTETLTKMIENVDLQTMATASLPPDKTVLSVDWTERVKLHQSDDTKECHAWALCSLQDGGWLVTDTNNNALKRVDDMNKVIDRCHIAPGFLWDVCFIADHGLAAVTTGNTIELVSLGDGMIKVRSIRTRHHSCGVTYCQEKLYITPYGENQIFEHDYNDGRQLRTICPQDSEGKDIFIRTGYITSSEDGSRLFLTDYNKGLFILDTETASVIQRVSIPGAEGICFDQDVGLFVSGLSRRVSPHLREINHLDKNGKQLGKLEGKSVRAMLEGHQTKCISYDKRTARLAQTLGEAWDYMYIFHLK